MHRTSKHKIICLFKNLILFHRTQQYLPLSFYKQLQVMSEAFVSQIHCFQDGRHFPEMNCCLKSAKKKVLQIFLLHFCLFILIPQLGASSKTLLCFTDLNADCNNERATVNFNIYFVYLCLLKTLLSAHINCRQYCIMRSKTER